ncbi:MAG: right-handed parallel beta-helix repeat-containing protein [Methanobrevibacter sp.]|nr:right-handed parallel beta-helix repeat-containing protein [Methanobrevibacter sp.]
MKLKYLAIISLFLVVVSMLTVVNAKTIEISENYTSKEIKNFFNNNGMIEGKKLSKGDTVIFLKGDYYGDFNLNIKKPVNIKSKGKVYFSSMTLKANNVNITKIDFNKLTINGNKNRITKSSMYLMDIRGSGNVINGNTVYGSPSTPYEYGIRVFGSQNKFSNNEINGYEDGIVLIKGTKNLISKNYFKNHKWNGVLIFSGSYNNKITANKFSRNNCGVFHYYGSKNTIYGNSYSRVKLKTSNFIGKGTLRYGY